MNLKLDMGQRLFLSSSGREDFLIRGWMFNKDVIGEHPRQFSSRAVGMGLRSQDFLGEAMITLRISSTDAGMRLSIYILYTHDGLSSGAEMSMKDDCIAEALLIK